MTGEHHSIYADIDRAFKKIKRLEKRIIWLEDRADVRENTHYSNLDKIRDLENKVSNLERGY